MSEISKHLLLAYEDSIVESMINDERDREDPDDF